MDPEIQVQVAGKGIGSTYEPKAASCILAKPPLYLTSTLGFSVRGDMSQIISSTYCGILFVILAIVWPDVASAVACHADPVCPTTLLTTRVCRRPCPEGGSGSGFVYQFGTDCGDGAEPVDGICGLSVINGGTALYRAGGGTAHKIPGSLPPGEVRSRAVPRPRSADGCIAGDVPDCAMQTRQVCRRPCGDNRFFYQFGSNCLDRSEPVDGTCLQGPDHVLQFTTGGGAARMHPGARRPGQEFHEVSSTVRWNCTLNPHVDGAAPAAREFTAVYRRRNQRDGGERRAGVAFNVEGLNEFIDSLTPDSGVDYGSCIRDLMSSVEVYFYSNCLTAEKASGAPESTASERCTGSRKNPHLQRFRSTMIRKMTELAALRNRRPPFLPMGAATGDERSLTSRASALAGSCFQAGMAGTEYYSDYFSAEFMQNHLPTAVQNMDPECKRKTLSDYLNLLAEIQMSECRRTPDTSACRQVRDATQSALRALQAAYGTSSEVPLSGLSGDRLAACAYTRGTDPAAFLRDLQIDTKFAGACTELGYPPPESSVISQSYSDAPTGVAGRYRLTRTGDKAYTAELRLVFTPEAQRSDYESRVATCLARTNRNLRGPDGQTLRIALNTSDTAIPSKEISIVDASARSNSGAWASGLPCETMAHEMLHILGLVDEYHEHSTGYLYNAGTGALRRVKSISREPAGDGERFFAEDNCRTEGPENSIMNTQTTAFGAVEGDERTRTSLLYPAHFNAITRPGCTSVNRTYYRCASYAYETSTSHYGSGCTNGRPAECRNGAGWLAGPP